MSYMGPERRLQPRRVQLERRGDTRWQSELVDRRFSPGRRTSDAPKTLTR
ncbi:hypothetical protein [Ferrimonas lipolytica]|uniref:Uncharacterized protein n=1 Tax=Ferrimonas lipolytica TaxID=2724191 RepID=A0A6H1UHS1_9GAMM|nr:hypothetical protein [Ferrimonas lipolytica]QIZ77766.1 hypothetical protein HER31_13175 [Ferrimonas lipolytica]